LRSVILTFEVGGLAGRDQKGTNRIRPIPLGTRGSFAHTVAPQHLASVFKESTLPPVLATPVMILVMENAALDAIRSFLEPGESAVGVAVNVRHLAPTPVGHLVCSREQG
jgi:fluoroacetyl-CoA thioesterase